MPKTYTVEIKPGFYLLRIDDDQIKYFEGLWYIPEGITYNAYLLKTKDGYVLFDAWKHIYGKEFINELKKIVDPKEIKYLIIHHMEPDHSGSIKDLLEINSEILVLGHPLTKGMIESFYNVKPKFKPVKDNEVLEIGEYKLQFIYTPWLHWPETIMTYIEDLHVLLTCDAFGSYNILDKIYDTELSPEEHKEYMFYTRKYIATVIGHYASWIEKALNKLESLGFNIEMIAPAHGIIWKNPDIIMKYYHSWSRGTSVSGKKKIVVVYSSMYGFVDKAVKEAVKVLDEKKAFYKVYRFLDYYRDKYSDLLADLLNSSAIILGTATYEASIFPLMRYILDLIIEKIPKNKKVLVITNYGWGGVAGKKIRELLTNNGFEVVDVVEFRAGQIDKFRDKIVEATNKLLEILGE
ncbi:beta-lactamase domain protein [Staphylothermus marinus F1]|uniref:Beta-lactamase domain protein n=1 Tax=Staphylothermus marinus (strain ATCC 43588 / DSM 3639 / JCM 9404 / F1) TaxID=399550 RepID=A3DKK9_STAMF|nr:FprA family A-type flavoprotein [Staphylothermus marinus]ABN69169.1 beta-lactamase domain protein [Staphylothermus marinus F1]